MNNFLCRNILEMSLSAGFCILLVLLIRPVFLKCSRKSAYYLWIAVFLNLVLPVRLKGPLSLIPTAAEQFITADSFKDNVPYPGESETADAFGITAQNTDAVQKDSAVSTGRPALSADSSTPAQHLLTEAEPLRNTDRASAQKNTFAGRFWKAADTYSPVLTAVWLAGLAVILLFQITQLARMKKWTAHENWVYWDDTVRAAEIAGIPAPFLWGFLHPVIFLPAGISQAERAYIIAHENFHRRRYDHLIKVAAFAAAAIHWFHPLVWAAWFLFCKDMEISCDEAVLSNAGPDMKKQYAQSILKYAAAQNGYYMMPPSFGSPSAKQRIHHILHFKKRSARFSKAAGCAAIAIVLLLSIHPAGSAAGTLDPQAQAGSAAGTLGPQAPAASASSSTKEPDADASPFGYTGYSGYLDACTKWEACRRFQNCDYDQDGLTDRVFRQETGTGSAACEYRIEFGNGDLIRIPDADCDGMPSVQAGDLDGDGKNEILFTQEYPLSTSPDSFGNMVLFTKTGGSYKEAALPLADSADSSHQPGLSIRYRMRGSDAFLAEIKETGYQARMQISEDFKDYYTRLFSEDEGNYSAHCVYSAVFEKAGPKTVLSCRVSLLDKWCIDDIAFWIVYENGAYTIQNMQYEPGN